jgi:DNA processing protein
MTEHEAYIAFNMTEKVGSATLSRLVAEHGSAAAAWEAYPSKISRKGGPVDWEGEVRRARELGVRIVTPADDEYPSQLRAVSGHPLALYVKGSVAALSTPMVAMVGTRKATAYGLEQADKFAYDLAYGGWTVVSGLALGIDAASHRGALKAEGVTVGVLGSALDEFYPEENRELAREIVQKGGAVVSQFPFGKPPDQQTFPIRNLVVAALARGVLAVECPIRSGTLITVSDAVDMGRTVMAVPSRVDSKSSAGCLKLIRDGAILVRNARDVEEEMSELLPRTQPKNAVRAPETAATLSSRSPLPQSEEDAPVPRFSLEEGMIMKHVDTQGVFIDALVEKTGLPAGKVNSLCMTLRLKGRVRFLPGNRVALPREV